MPDLPSVVSVTELDALRRRPDIRIVDCRFSLLDPGKGRADFAESHIPGAVYAHLDDDLAAPPTAVSGRHPLPSAAEFSATLCRLGIGSGTRVVAYDDGSGGVAARLWWMLRWLGHDDAAVLDGGYAAWRARDLPISSDVTRYPPGDFTASPDARMAIGTDELRQRLASPRGYLLVDGRDASRFRGDAEPIDPVAGHIPGAVNLPFTRSLNEAGRWRPAEELRALWTEATGLAAQEDDWAVMCGSGVTACHLALSALRAGLAEPRIYVGSWSEWIRDKSRPVAR